jgi:hypothetical protein
MVGARAPGGPAAAAAGCRCAPAAAASAVPACASAELGPPSPAAAQGADGDAPPPRRARPPRRSGSKTRGGSGGAVRVVADAGGGRADGAVVDAPAPHAHRQHAPPLGADRCRTGRGMACVDGFLKRGHRRVTRPVFLVFFLFAVEGLASAVSPSLSRPLHYLHSQLRASVDAPVKTPSPGALAQPCLLPGPHPRVRERRHARSTHSRRTARHLPPGGAAHRRAPVTAAAGPTRRRCVRAGWPCPPRPARPACLCDARCA